MPEAETSRSQKARTFRFPLTPRNAERSGKRRSPAGPGRASSNGARRRKAVRGKRLMPQAGRHTGSVCVHVSGTGSGYASGTSGNCNWSGNATPAAGGRRTGATAAATAALRRGESLPGSFDDPALAAEFPSPTRGGGTSVTRARGGHVPAERAQQPVYRNGTRRLRHDLVSPYSCV